MVKYKFSGQEISKDQYDTLKTVSLLGKAKAIDSNSARSAVIETLLTKPNQTNGLLDKWMNGGNNATPVSTTPANPTQKTIYDNTPGNGRIDPSKFRSVPSTPNVAGAQVNTSNPMGVQNTNPNKQEGRFGFGAGTGELFGQGGLIDNISLPFRRELNRRSGALQSFATTAEDIIGGKTLAQSLIKQGADPNIVRNPNASVDDVLKTLGNVFSNQIPFLVSKEQSKESWGDPINNFLKDQASMASWALPGVGAAGGTTAAITSGVGSGLLAGYGGSEKGQELQDTLIGGVTGLVTAGLLKGANKIFSRGAKEAVGATDQLVTSGGNLTSDAAYSAGQKIKYSILKPSLTLLKEEGLAPSDDLANRIARRVGSLMEDSSFSIGTRAKSSNSLQLLKKSLVEKIEPVFSKFNDQAMNSTDILASWRQNPAVKNISGLFIDAPEGIKFGNSNVAGKQASKLWKDFVDEAGLTARPSSIRRFISMAENDLSKSAFNDAATSQKDQVTRSFTRTLRNTLDDLISRSGADDAAKLEATQLMEDLSYANIVEKGLTKPGSTGTAHFSSGLVSQNRSIAPITQRINYGVGKTLDSISGAGGTTNAIPFSQLGKGASAVLDNKAVNWLTPPVAARYTTGAANNIGTEGPGQGSATTLTGNSIGEQTFPLPTATTNQQTDTPYGSESDLRQILARGVSSGDITAADAKAYLDLFYPEKKSKNISLTDTVKITAAKQGIRNLQDIANLISTGVQLQGGLPAFLQTTEGQKFERAISDAIDKMARARTGAQINDQERPVYRAMFPQVGDSNETIMYKLQSAYNELFDIASFENQ